MTLKYLKMLLFTIMLGFTWVLLSQGMLKFLKMLMSMVLLG